MSELMEKAVKEGISLPGQEAAAENPPKTDGNTSVPSTENKEQTNTAHEAAAKPDTALALENEPAKKTRFEDNPGFQNLVKQRNSYREELRRAQEANQQLEARIAALDKATKSPAAPSSEKEEAAKQLASILGLDKLVEKLEKLESRNSEFTQKETDQAFDREEETINKKCEQFGLKPDEVKAELQRYLDEHPYFSKVEIQPGFYEIAFKALYFDRTGELAEKSAQRKQIEEREKLKKANSEAPSSAPASKETTKEPSIRDQINKMVREGGGEIKI